MKILFIGGTGVISTACTALAAQRGIEVTLLTRGQHASDLPAGVKTLRADVNDPALVQKLANASFDAVVDFIAFTAADVERDLALFRGRTRQFVFNKYPPAVGCQTTVWTIRQGAGVERSGLA